MPMVKYYTGGNLGINLLVDKPTGLLVVIVCGRGQALPGVPAGVALERGPAVHILGVGVVPFQDNHVTRLTLGATVETFAHVSL